MQNIYDNHCSYMYVCIVTQFDPDWHWGKPDGILQAADARGILPYFARGGPVGVYLLTILTNQGDIGKVRIFSEICKCCVDITFEIIPLETQFFRHVA